MITAMLPMEERGQENYHFLERVWRWKKGYRYVTIRGASVTVLTGSISTVNSCSKGLAQMSKMSKKRGHMMRAVISTGWILLCPPIMVRQAAIKV